ncbi:hypothetical protein [Enhygromyxa salina]|uniref:N-acetyltransferase domain-containing protein n=1 Tax=Enhygromyxa salina TaxID=215803 RepID=A0A2S9YSL9_9BACT|nr:hypothetical protein [Enhygromyxa salina]PRQ08088.1 hypothetical protein ENSA7_22420 [Enhygromyxa salina]
MLDRIRSEVIDPHRLPSSRKQALIDDLYATHAAIFTGVSRERFVAYVIDSLADRTRIAVYRAGGQVVGYLAVHTFVREIEGQQWVVVRGETGKLPAYRRAALGGLMISEVLRVCVRYPGANKVFLGCFVHPSAYLALAHVAPEIYPHWDQPTPTQTRSVMDRLAVEFGLEPVDGARPGVCGVGWITRESEAERAAWTARCDPMARLFLRENPDYNQGTGLLTLVPISFAGLVTGTLRHVGRECRRRLARMRASSLSRRVDAQIRGCTGA